MSEGNGKSRLPKRLAPNDLAATESVQAFYTAQPSEGTTKDEVLDSAFWTHVARSIRSGSEIRVFPKGGAWYGRYLVTYADSAQVRLRELEYVDLDEVLPEELENGQYEVKWAGPVARHRVIRKSDKHVMRDKFASKAEASHWMMTNLRV